MAVSGKRPTLGQKNNQTSTKEARREGASGGNKGGTKLTNPKAKQNISQHSVNSYVHKELKCIYTNSDSLLNKFF